MLYRVACFFARDHGISGLKALLEQKSYVVACIFTHRFLPRSEDPGRCERPEFAHYESLAREHKFPLYSVDDKAERALVGENLAKHTPIDFIVSISWRNLIPGTDLARARIGTINLHRGKLPEYAGAEPIKQALANREKEIVITAHMMTEVIDEGEIVGSCHHPVNYDARKSTDENVARLKREITPYFGNLLIQSLDKLARRYEDNER